MTDNHPHQMSDQTPPRTTQLWRKFVDRYGTPHGSWRDIAYEVRDHSHQLERELAAAIAERDAARAEAAELREKLEAAMRPDGGIEDQFVARLFDRLSELDIDASSCDGEDDPALVIADWVAGRIHDADAERDQLRERVERLRRALEYYAGAPWVAHHGPWHNANFADVADKALSETEPKGEA